MRYHLMTGILWLCLSYNAAAQMLISNPVVHFDPGSPKSQDVEVINTGKDILYAQINIFRVPNPDNTKEREAITDPRDAGLLVTPNRLIVPPGGRKLLRLMVRTPASKEDLVYRVRVEPKVGGLETEQQEERKQLGIKILVGYELLVIVRPPDAKPNIEIVRTGNVLSFSNQGNTNVAIRKIVQCNADKSDCEEIQGKRLYAGSVWEVELPRDGAAEVYESYGLENSVRQF